jgi:hypothetical protein
MYSNIIISYYLVGGYEIAQFMFVTWVELKKLIINNNQKDIN